MIDPSERPADPDARIVAALERLSRAFRTVLREEADARDLSPTQAQLLVHLLHHGPALRRVGRLAEEFQLSAPTVSDAVSTLEAKGLVRKAASPRDGRVTLLRLTPRGERLAAELEGWTDVVREQVAGLPEPDKAATLRALLELIASLHAAGVITVARMCLTCRFFEPDGGSGPEAPHYCRLLEMPLSASDLRLDCPDHQPRAAAAG